MNVTEVTDQLKVEFSDSLLWFFLLIAFLTSETGNACFMYTMCKKKFSTTTGNLLKAFSISSALMGVVSILPQCISMVNKTWLDNTILCRTQGFLSNVFLISTSLLLLCQSSERYFLQDVRHANRRKSTFKVLITAIFIFSGLMVGLASFKAEPFTYSADLFSCDLPTDNITLVVNTFCVAVPCFGTIVISLFSVLRPKRCQVMPMSLSRRNRCVEQGINRNNRETMQAAQSLTNDKKISKVFAVLLCPMSTVILITCLLRHIAHAKFHGREEMVRLGLFLFGFSALVQPCILLLFSNSMKTSVFEFLFRQKMATMSCSRPFKLIQNAPQPRSDLTTSEEVPAFLQTNPEMELHVQVSSNITSPEDQTALSRKESSISYDIQFAKLTSNSTKESIDTDKDMPRNIERDRLVSFSSIASNDSLFIKIGTSIDAKMPWNSRSPSIGISDSLPRLRSRISIDTISNYSKSRHGSSDSDHEINRRQTIAPLSYNMSLVHKILPQAWVSENVPQEMPTKRRHSSHSKSSRLGYRMQVLGTLTPVESVSSMDVSPRISTDSSNLVIGRHPLRLSRLHSCLHKLEEAS